MVKAAQDQHIRGLTREIEKVNGTFNLVISEHSIVVCCSAMRQTLRALRRTASERGNLTNDEVQPSFEDLPLDLETVTSELSRGPDLLTMHRWVALCRESLTRRAETATTIVLSPLLITHHWPDEYTEDELNRRFHELLEAFT